jgi:hypothetical protein
VDDPYRRPSSIFGRGVELREAPANEMLPVLTRWRDPWMGLKRGPTRRSLTAASFAPRAWPGGDDAYVIQ